MKSLIRPMYRSWRKRQFDLISSKLSSKFGDVVLDGPFQGLKYVKSACVSFPPSKRMGSYECELAEVVEHIVSNNYDRIGQCNILSVNCPLSVNLRAIC
jgi:hypothetical protein